MIFRKFPTVPLRLSPMGQYRGDSEMSEEVDQSAFELLSRFVESCGINEPSYEIIYWFVEGDQEYPGRVQVQCDRFVKAYKLHYTANTFTGVRLGLFIEPTDPGPVPDVTWQECPVSVE